MVVKLKPTAETLPKSSVYHRQSACTWPETPTEAYKRERGPYTQKNAETMISEEPVELYNGWLVWQEMTNLDERRIVDTIQAMLNNSARHADFGQTLPDQVECLMSSGEVVKPDLSLVSWQRLEAQRLETETGHTLLKGAPELVIEVRSPSNRRTEEQRKRTKYFANGAQIVWDIDPKRKRIWVYHAETSMHPQSLTVEDEIDCEPLLPGWHRRVADLFNPHAPEAAVFGEVVTAAKAEGEAEGEASALRRTLLLLAELRFGPDLPADLPARLANCGIAQLRALEASVKTAATTAEWLAKLT